MNNPYVDEELKDIYKKAISIIKEHQKGLLKYNDETCLSKAMTPISNVLVNKRSNMSRRGCCKFNRRCNNCIIEISKYMLSLPEDEILTTMIHEILHTFKDSEGHGSQWTWRARYLSEKTGLNIQRVRHIDGSDEAIQSLKEENASKPWMYKYRCTGCGKEVVKSKNSKFGKFYQHYKCGSCGGLFEKLDKSESTN